MNMYEYWIGSMQADKCQYNCQTFLKKNVLKLKFKTKNTYVKNS